MSESLETWWSALTPLAKLFYGIGLLATCLLIVQTVLTIVGLDGMDADVDVDFDVDVDMDVDSHTEIVDDVQQAGIGFLSVRTVVAFLAGFGWIGAILMKGSAPIWIVLPVAFGAGVVLMFLIFFLMRLLWSLRESGTLNYRNAVGENGVVYLPIPPKREGRGQVEVMIQGRLQTVPAITSHDARLENRSKILVVEVMEDNTLVVVPDDLPSDDL